MSMAAGELMLAAAATALSIGAARLLRVHRSRDCHPELPAMLSLAQTIAEQFVPKISTWAARPLFRPLMTVADRDLRLAGLSPVLLPRHWAFILAGVAGLAAAMVLLLCLIALAFGFKTSPLSTALFVSLSSLVLTQQWLRRRAQTREAGLLRELPAGLELLALSLECGCALQPALEIASRHLPIGALRQILRSLHADLAAGRSRVAALRRLFDLNQGSVIAPTLGALVQAEAAGSSLAPVLRAQARQRTEERFAAAEKAALQAPVKMLLPLISCIFPCTFIVIAFPLVTRFLQ